MRAGKTVRIFFTNKATVVNYLIVKSILLTITLLLYFFNKIATKLAIQAVFR